MRAKVELYKMVLFFFCFHVHLYKAKIKWEKNLEFKKKTKKIKTSHIEPTANKRPEIGECYEKNKIAVWLTIEVNFSKKKKIKINVIV